MKIPQKLPQFNNTHALIVVMSKDHGILYHAHDSEIDRIAALNNPPARYSNRKGFFMRKGGGVNLGSGGPYSGKSEENRQRFINNLVEELRDVIKEYAITKVYLFEPQYLKGQLAELLTEQESAHVVLVDFGNFVNEKPLELLERIDAHENPVGDPSDPSSVAGEENAEGKRKILEVGKKVEG